MQTSSFYYRSVYGLILLCHLLAGSQFWLTRAELQTPVRWIGQFYLLLGLSLFSSLLLLRCRRRVTGFAALGTAFIMFLVIGYGAGAYLGVELTLLTSLLIAVSASFTWLPALGLSGLMILLTLFNQQPIRAWETTLPGASLHDLLSLGIYAALVTLLANSLSWWVQALDSQQQTNERLDKAASQLITANLDFQRYALAAEASSAAQERKRISRDIHDTAVHILMNIIMLAEAGCDRLHPEQTKLARLLQQIIAQAKEAVRDTRQALRELRDLEAPVLTGLEAIQRLCKVFAEATSVKVHVDYGNLPWEFAPQLDRVVYRIIQEGLTNAFRHGKATQIDVRLWISDLEGRHEFIVRIHDNGLGAAEIQPGIGLQGMEERLQRLHGTLTAKNSAGGFELTARIPLRHEDFSDGDDSYYSG